MHHALQTLHDINHHAYQIARLSGQPNRGYRKFMQHENDVAQVNVAALDKMDSLHQEMLENAIMYLQNQPKGLSPKGVEKVHPANDDLTQMIPPVLQRGTGRDILFE
jgi:hypothetical protein